MSDEIWFSLEMISYFLPTSDIPGVFYEPKNSSPLEQDDGA